MAWTIFFLVAMGGRRHSDGGCGFFPFFLLAIFFAESDAGIRGGDIMKGAPENDDPSFLCRPVNRGGGGEGRKRKKFPRIRGAPPPPQRQLRK